MLPSFEICESLLKAYKEECEGNTKLKSYEKAWKDIFHDFKVRKEEEGENVLDDRNVYETAKKLHGFLNVFGALRGGPAINAGQVAEILHRVKPDFDAIRSVRLGQGKIRGHREALKAVYLGLDGIKPNGIVMAKGKALMALWGEIPGFDTKVRHNLSYWEPHAYHESVRDGHWSSDTFCDVIEELDVWVSEWPGENGGRTFDSLADQLGTREPSGRLVDLVYWRHHPSP